MTAVPRPSRTRLRTAWNATCGVVGAGLDAMSPPVLAGPARRREAAGPRQGGRPPAGETEPIVEQARAEADRDRQPAAGRPVASPVSPGGAIGCRPPSPTARPALNRAAAAVHVFSIATTSARAGRQVERGEGQPILGRRDDAGLVGAVEGRRDRPAAGPPTVPDRTPVALPRRRTADARRARRHRAGQRRSPAVSDASRRPRRGVGAARRHLYDTTFSAHLRQRLGERVDLVGQLLRSRPCDSVR